VGRAIVASSPVIFADEPTASLDATSRDLVCDALSTAASDGALVIVSTHDPAVAAIAQRVLHLEAGRIARDIRDGDRTPS
jgi:ABC-type lipoprotein export system ATPase subunit